MFPPEDLALLRGLRAVRDRVGHWPTGPELAEYLGLPAEDVYSALDSARRRGLVRCRRRGGPESVWIPRVGVV